MKYHDSIKTADKIMVLAVAQLKKWQLAINPINYAVVYEYYKKSNPNLTTAIEQELAVHEVLSGFFMENLYKDQLLEQSIFREEIITDLSNLLNATHENQTDFSLSSESLLEQLDYHIPQLRSHKAELVDESILALENAVQQFKLQTQQLTKKLELSQKENEKLSSELTKARQSVNLDPTTGLFNPKVITSHVDAWHEEHDPCNIAAIAIKIEGVHEIEQEFGVLLADIILSKIANKISSYVNDSGLPVRLNYDEFILLLPQIDNKIATEIGIKIKQGIQRMRFVSIKTSIKLPQINTHFSVNHMVAGEKEIQSFISDTRLLLNE